MGVGLPGCVPLELFVGTVTPRAPSIFFDGVVFCLILMMEEFG